MAISISVLILAIGLISLFTLPVEQYPDIAPPTVYVTASYTGADAEAVMAESCAEVFNGADPAILEGIYISAKYWDDAVKGENPAAPAMRLHVASGKNLSLIWMSDGSPLIEAGRGE